MRTHRKRGACSPGLDSYVRANDDNHSHISDRRSTPRARRDGLTTTTRDDATTTVGWRGETQGDQGETGIGERVLLR